MKPLETWGTRGWPVSIKRLATEADAAKTALDPRLGGAFRSRRGGVEVARRRPHVVVRSVAVATGASGYTVAAVTSAAMAASAAIAAVATATPPMTLEQPTAAATLAAVARAGAAIAAAVAATVTAVTTAIAAGTTVAS